MENAALENTDYSFLAEESVEKHFANLNLKLLSGRHIQQEDFSVFSLLEDYYPQLKTFYLRIYTLDLVRAIADKTVYFYLNFFDGSRGKLGDPSRYKTLSEMNTIIGLLLLDMYYSRYFEHPKTITWSDIRKEIEEGDRKMEYQRILFQEVRAGYTGQEWVNVEKKFAAAIRSFDDLGWVNKLSGQQEELIFEIQPSIHRLAELYANELEHFDTFSENYKIRSQE